MPVFDSNKAIFIHIPKNAGTAVMNTLGPYLDFGHHQWMFYKNKYPKKWKTFFRFCIVRNPWDRVVSNYTYARMLKSYWHSPDKTTVYGVHRDYYKLKDLSFEDTVKLLPKINFNKRFPQRILKHQGWQPQEFYVVNKGGKIVADIFRFENLNQDFKKKFGRDLLKINTSNNERPYQEWYNEQTRDIVSRVYARDIELFGYSF